ncbi:Shugoshin C terminus [Teratosphaeria destructans]|uniref:Shugoshin C terminus n=1 Tax=Teratosphaeria destructans TaxID=418781 RepID=A0A9W7SIP8_9PEZI|nr:Shugoshin C terminus [Teratosphaeria destructans]
MRTKSRPVVQKAPADFDEVRRRFIRQNRELAKANSSQSLRIRNLELEVSRLLSDNLELREKAFRFESDLWHAQRQLSGDAVQRIKQELQAKLAELSGIVSELDDAARPQDGVPAKMPYERPPLEGQWRERQPLIESMRETAMPTISEDKLYARRTLDAGQIQAIRLSDHSSNESPDLGPPPVAHFDYEDPVKPQTSPTASRSSPVDSKEDDDTLPGLSVNLETRRRRKDGQPKLVEIRRRSILPQSPEKEGEGSTMLRTGAKRKLADREMDRPTRPLVKDEFTFSRKPTLSEAKVLEVDAISTCVEANNEPAVESNPDEPLAEVQKPARKVLGEKSANMSPRKVTISRDKGEDSGPEKSEKRAPGRPKPATGGSRTRAKRVSSLPLPSPSRDSNAPEVDDIAPPTEPIPSTLLPKTPAVSDLFSPTPSVPSAKLDDSRTGTPPPSDISTMSITTDGGMRPSRRARGAVNYAEPSLNAKMRRPGKQMVDAISGLQPHTRVISAPSERRSCSASRPVSIKQEPVEDDDAWKHAPSAAETRAVASPLGTKSSDPGTELNPALQTSDNDSAPIEPSSASTNLSTLLSAGTRKRRTTSERADHLLQPLGTDMEATVKRMEELDLYDFKDSSPASTDEKPAPSKKGHRRHSSVPKDVVSTIGEEGGGRRTGASRAAAVASRRRSMVL